MSADDLAVFTGSFGDGKRYVFALNADATRGVARAGNDPDLMVATGGRIRTAEQAAEVAALCQAVEDAWTA